MPKGARRYSGRQPARKSRDSRTSDKAALMRGLGEVFIEPSEIDAEALTIIGPDRTNWKGELGALIAREEEKRLRAAGITDEELLIIDNPGLAAARGDRVTISLAGEANERFVFEAAPEQPDYESILSSEGLAVVNGSQIFDGSNTDTFQGTDSFGLADRSRGEVIAAAGKIRPLTGFDEHVIGSGFETSDNDDTFGLGL